MRAAKRSIKATDSTATAKIPDAIADAVKAMLATTGISAATVEMAFAILDGRAVAVTPEAKARMDAAPLLEPLVTREELARLLKRSVKDVDYLRRKGRLTPVRVSGSSRISGFTAASVRALLTGAN